MFAIINVVVETKIQIQNLDVLKKIKQFNTIYYFGKNKAVIGICCNWSVGTTKRINHCDIQ